MNSLAFSAVLLLAAGAMAQYRPFYAGSGVNYPRPFGSGSDDGLGNRFGGETTELTSRVDEFGHDKKLVEEAAKAPEAQKPFWYLNREQILKHIGINNPSVARPSQTNQPIQRIQPVQPVENYIQPSPLLLQPAPNANLA